MFIKTKTLKVSKESPNTNMYVFVENSKEEVSELQKKFTDKGNFILIMDVYFNIIEIGKRYNFYTKIISKKTQDFTWSSLDSIFNNIRSGNISVQYSNIKRYNNSKNKKNIILNENATHDKLSIIASRQIKLLKLTERI